MTKMTRNIIKLNSLEFTRIMGLGRRGSYNMGYSSRGYSSSTSSPTSIPTTIDGLMNPIRMDNISTADLMSVDLHIGHSKSSWNPNMLPFIYGTRHGLHIINLSETMAALKRAHSFLFHVAREGGNVLFVGTRPMLHHLVWRLAEDNNAFFTTRWVGGLLTNKERVLRRSVGYDPDKVSQSLQAQSSSSLSFSNSPPTKRKNHSSKQTNNNSNNSANPADQDDKQETMDMIKTGQPQVALPDVIVLLDYPNTKWAVREANLAHVPVVAICDTDCDPALVQYPIPASDDSLAGVELVANLLGQACKSGHDAWVAASASATATATANTSASA